MIVIENLKSVVLDLHLFKALIWLLRKTYFTARTDQNDG